MTNESHVQAIIANMIDTFAFLSGNSPLVQFVRTAACARIETDLPLPIFNRVFSYMPEGDAAAEVGSIAESYRARGMRCSWHTYSHAPDEAVEQALRANGFEFGGSLTGMAASLEGRTIAAERVPGLGISAIRTEEELASFKRVFVAEYGLPDALAAAFTDAFAFDPKGRARYYLASLNGEPVGSAMTYGEGDTAGLYTVATLKAFRSRGIGSAVTAYALRDMQESGIKFAILQASPMGTNVYRRLGFDDAVTINVHVG
ncbi:GNAT family N-acetyltransferase [Paenibacillus sp. MWE-103]|uniref:GNAT family N-acetyltransferase n=1 Tax=Paenibacillus artemisiicola TaxID=1172618 RepID=A0ABS3W3Q2_9BACL|nr:GNAT family N-acetyltransferase [Paenibacillus artemisiicola]MBO7742935.1 GNAT family N-acetyltransferase [Paenibacillus artemisiicola]